jgi:hypothetical protein
MSQRKFRTDEYEVLTGWDSPLQYFYLVIENTEGEMVFSNLNLPNPALTLDQIREWFHVFEITPPPTLYTDLLTDHHNESMESFEYSQHHEILRLLKAIRDRLENDDIVD